MSAMSDPQNEATAPHLSAIAGQDDMERLHALCGTRLYCVSTLAGRFPDLGWH
jgi:hypothetical protein